MGWVSKGSYRVLDFDIENRPLHYLSNDWTSAEITAIGWSWLSEEEVHTLMLQSDGTYEDENGVRRPPAAALEMFCDLLSEADLVTGHYIRKHDLPIIQSALIELGLSPLPAMLTHDTVLDLVKRKDLSAGQENLASTFRLPEPKHHMTQDEWRQANRLLPDGITASRKRVVDDVVQHKALRAELLKRNLLKAPRMWRP